MKQISALVFAALLAFPAVAQEAGAAESAVLVAPDPAANLATDPIVAVGDDVAVVELKILDAATVSLAEFQWIARPVVVFADTPADPRFTEQLDLLLARPEELMARDVVVLTDTDPTARSEVRLKLRPRGFMLTLIDKDGTVNLRKPAPWDVRELTRAIDKMPSRQEEIRAQKLAAE